MKYVRATPEEVRAIIKGYDAPAPTPSAPKRMCDGYPACRADWCKHAKRHDTLVFPLDGGASCFCHQTHKCPFSIKEVICGILPHAVENGG